jgi:hypothetical protein
MPMGKNVPTPAPGGKGEQTQNRHSLRGGRELTLVEAKAERVSQGLAQPAEALSLAEG